MVLKGDFSVRIVEAESKVKFQEHKHPNDNGKFFAEVEPDVDYYIEIDILQGSGPDIKTYFCDLIVDGTKLGYQILLSSGGGKYYAGCWSQDENTSTMEAFRFEKPRMEFAEDGTSSYDPGSLMGSVEVEFYEAIFDGYKTYTKTIYSGEKNPLAPSSVRASEDAAQNKKVLRSGKGGHAESKPVSHQASSSEPVYNNGGLVDSITVHYCTALGLIHAGVLTKPDDPYWEARMTNPWKGPALDGIEIKKRKREGVIENGVMVEPPKELDLYDLATAESDDES